MKVYGLYHKGNLFYVGSTQLPLPCRFSAHKFCFKNGDPKFEGITDWEDVRIQELEDCSDKDRQYLYTRERHYIETLKPAKNIKIPARTAAERYQDKKEEFKQYYQQNKDKYRQYYLQNRESKLQYQKQYEKKKRQLRFQESCSSDIHMTEPSEKVNLISESRVSNLCSNCCKSINSPLLMQPLKS